jgi:flagellar M-ring protein FliF
MQPKEVAPEMITLVSKATGFPEANISIIAYDVPIFQEKQGALMNAADIAQIVLIVLILGLLAFVVISSLRRERKEVAPEEELSVESLLQTTQEAEIEDIDLEAKSEVRMMVEKFVDENPDAAAALLRNWLNEEWG